MAKRDYYRRRGRDLYLERKAQRETEEYRAKQREKFRLWRQKNPEKFKAIVKKWRQKNRSRYLESRRIAKKRLYYKKQRRPERITLKAVFLPILLEAGQQGASIKSIAKIASCNRERVKDWITRAGRKFVHKIRHGCYAINEGIEIQSNLHRRSRKRRSAIRNQILIVGKGNRLTG